MNATLSEKQNSLNINQIDANSDELFILADEQDPNKEFDELYLTNHTYRDNLTWMTAIVSKIAPTNEELNMLLLISAITAGKDFKTRLHVFIRGEYGSGKTKHAQTVLNLLNLKHKVNIDGVVHDTFSPKAMFYATKRKIWNPDEKKFDMCPILFDGRVVYQDDVTEGNLAPLKQLTNTSDKTPTYLVTDAQNSSVKEFVMDGIPVCWVSKVDGLANDDGQLSSRFYVFENKKKVVEISKHIIHFEETNELKTEQSKVSIFLNKLIDTPCIWDIPDNIKNQIPIPSEESTARNTTFALAMLKAISKINTKDITKSIIPTQQDLEYVKLFFSKETVAHTQITNMSKTARTIIEHITHTEPDIEQMKAGINISGSTVLALMKVEQIRQKYSQITVSRAIDELYKAGYIEMYKAAHGKRYFFRIEKKI